MSIQISDAELSVMKVLWQESPLPYSEIFQRMQGNNAQLKTMLQRLVAKGAIEATPMAKRTYLYILSCYCTTQFSGGFWLCIKVKIISTSQSQPIK